VNLPHWLRWAGLPVGLAAGAWITWMFRSLGANLTDTVTVRTGATLVTGGPYRWVRHPLYTGAAMMVVSISLLAASVYFAVGGALVVLLLVVRTRTEEAQLEARFGEAYRAYRSRTGFLLPRLR
jgi:protein-S-isoprenylcysteine O-methyltransferase Ste14